jgi:hypothetical protein
MTVGSGCIKKIGQLELANLFYTATAHGHVMVWLSLSRICPVNLSSSWPIFFIQPLTTVMLCYGGVVIVQNLSR